MIPAFAVVGHPNKGKSSIVSTVAQNDSISISAASGTTQDVQRLDVAVGDSRYFLYDTPGFQRPTRVLAWLAAHAETAEQRAEAVRRFINDSDCQREFPEEVKLLTPIMEGAAILYIVDGSRPYGADYEAEMEILRWTGQASMALINPIESEAHVDEWKQALTQYFKIVRVFNAMQADFEKLLAILEAFSHIREEWCDAINSLVQDYRRDRGRQGREAAGLMSELLIRLCSYQVSQKALSQEQAKQLRPALEVKYFNDMRGLEHDYHEALKSLYYYHAFHTEIEELPLQDNLFDTEQWVAWGLNRRQLTMAAAMAGAATGAALDLAVAGSSLMLGALGGGLIGATSAWLGASQIAEFRIQGLPVGGFESRQGPVQNRNFPYVVLNRFLVIADALKQRTHAHREQLVMKEGDLAQKIERLDKRQQQLIHRALNRLSRQRSVEGLPAVLTPLLL